jgi:hypothetical protein
VFDLPGGSDIFITTMIDQESGARVSAFIPALNQKFDSILVIDLARPNLNLQKEKLAWETERLQSLRTLLAEALVEVDEQLTPQIDEISAIMARQESDDTAQVVEELLVTLKNNLKGLHETIASGLHKPDRMDGAPFPPSILQKTTR